jgi:hypothetical protein
METRDDRALGQAGVVGDETLEEATKLEAPFVW